MTREIGRRQEREDKSSPKPGQSPYQHAPHAMPSLITALDITLLS